MTEPTQTTPSPIAVPWTPDRSNASPTAPLQASLPHQPQAYAPSPVQANPVHPTQQAQSPTQAQPIPQPYQAQQRPQLHAPTPVSVPAPVAAHPAQTHLVAYPGHMQPAVPPVQQPPAPQPETPQPMVPHHSPTQQSVPPQHQQQHQQQTAQHLQHTPQPYATHAPSQPPMMQQAPQNLHAGPPPLAPQAHMQSAHMSEMYEDQPQSKSLLAGLLKRSPRPDTVATDIPVASTGRESLFNKNFMLGGLTGLVIGAFLLPMVIGLFSSDAPQPQARNFTQSSASITPPSTAEGGSFIDDAIARDVP